jgi:hypothetical protein
MLKQRARAASQLLADSVGGEQSKEAQPRAEDVVVVDSPQQQWKSSDKHAQRGDGKKLTEDELLRQKIDKLVRAVDHVCVCVCGCLCFDT